MSLWKDLKVKTDHTFVGKFLDVISQLKKVEYLPRKTILLRKYAQEW